MLTTLFITC